MKTIPAALNAHLQQELTTTALLLRLIRADGTTYAYTTHDRDLTVGGVTYQADGAFQATQLESQRGFAPDNLDLLGLLDSAGITAADIDAGRFDAARVEIHLVNWANVAQGTALLRSGTVGKITQSGGRYSFEVRGLLDRLQQTVGETCSRQCRYHLGEARCTVDLTAGTWRKVGVLTGIATNLTPSDTARAEAVGFFAGGTLTLTTGANAGLRRPIKTFSAGTFTLWEAFPVPLALGDAYTATAGCDKRFTTCQTKFNNAVNFGGFPHLPGSDAILATPSMKVD